MKRSDILKQSYDLIIIGGGITGAGVFREASRMGLSCLLLEQKDFAWGTSSKSGKLVHGGLRYLSQGQMKTTYHSVRERQMMLTDYPEIVKPLDFYIPIRKGDIKTCVLLKAGLTVYDLMAFRIQHQKLSHDSFMALVPQIAADFVGNGYRFQDALTDDIRLVIQVIKEASEMGGFALNYAGVSGLLKTVEGVVFGVRVIDEVTGSLHDINADMVINATGAWVDDVRYHVQKQPIIRRLRGSHLVVSGTKLTLPGAVTITHPKDERPLYVLPWKGAILIGTTDLDHSESLYNEPYISPAEAEYMLEAVNYWFPDVQLKKTDVISTMAGIRPVVDTGKADPSKESREHIVLNENGLISVTGGKMTTFRLLAEETLLKALLDSRKRTGENKVDTRVKPNEGCFENDDIGVSEVQYQRILARLKTCIAEEWVVHLDDLLLRRTRVGILTRNGGLDQVNRLKADLKDVLSWDDEQWDMEIERYRKIWQSGYSPDLMG